MAEPAARRATYEDLLNVPSHLVAEMIGGTLRTHARPGPKHARAASRLGACLDGPFDRGISGPGGWWPFDEPELHLASDILVPDLAGWRVERMPDLPDTAYFELTPDWICEVLSPSTAAEDRADKLPIYATGGVAHLWLIDPLLRTLEAYRCESQRWLLLQAFRGHLAVHVEPFAEIPLDLASLWSNPKSRV